MRASSPERKGRFVELFGPTTVGSGLEPFQGQAELYIEASQGKKQSGMAF